MPLEGYRPKINYLRISVTDRCNLRCVYCMPEYGILQKDPGEILSFEEILKIVQIGAGMGIDRIRITGGEPLVRRNLPQLLSLLSALPGIKDLSLTTNGVLLKKFAKKIREAGLNRLNISIDALDSQKFRAVTRSGNLGDVLGGIDAAIKEGFFIKLNVVMIRGVNDDQVLKFAGFARDKKLILRFIEFMPILSSYSSAQRMYISSGEIKQRLGSLGVLKPASVEQGNGPAQYYEIEGTSLVVGFISPISCKFCSACNRLRLTADGLLMPCLVGNHKFDLKRSLRNSREKDLEGLIKKAIGLKAQAADHSGFSSQGRYTMSQIGG